MEAARGKRKYFRLRRVTPAYKFSLLMKTTVGLLCIISPADNLNLCEAPMGETTGIRLFFMECWEFFTLSISITVGQCQDLRQTLYTLRNGRSPTLPLSLIHISEPTR